MQRGLQPLERLTRGPITGLPNQPVPGINLNVYPRSDPPHRGWFTVLGVGVLFEYKVNLVHHVGDVQRRALHQQTLHPGEYGTRLGTR